MFIAHTNDILDNHYKPLEQFNKKKVLTKSEGKCFLKSNICPHQLSLITKSSGEGDRVCPYHGWAFDIQGTPMSSGRTGHYCKNNLPLKDFNLYQFKDLLFNVDISSKELHWLDLSKMQLKEQRIDRVVANSNIIMDVFLDVDHIECVHAGVYDKIGLPKINQVQWHFYNWGSLQLVAKGEEYGAAWLAIYPGTMIEWQQGALFVTQSVAVNDKETDVHVFKYSDSENDWKLNEEVWETAWAQDKEQAELITGFTNNNLEESKKHFRQWLTK